MTPVTAASVSGNRADPVPLQRIFCPAFIIKSHDPIAAVITGHSVPTKKAPPENGIMPLSFPPCKAQMLQYTK